MDSEREYDIDALEGSWEGEQPGDCDGGLWPELEFEMGRYL